MKETILVTGASGFTGRHLCTMLRRQGDCAVVETSRCLDSEREVCDLGSVDQLREMVDRHRPSKIYHCAGSFSNLWETDIPANVEATRNLLEAVLHSSPATRVLLIGSAAEYGIGKIGAIHESDCLAPVSVYGISKAMQSFLMSHYVEMENLDIVLARTFNLYGTGISPDLFPGRVQQQIEAVSNGEKEYIEVRSLHTSRDYIPVNKAIESYIRVMNYGEQGEVYNVGSGSPTLISDLIKDMLKGTGFGMERVRATDEGGFTNEEVSFADIEKLQRLPQLNQ